MHMRVYMFINQVFLFLHVNTIDSRVMGTPVVNIQQTDNWGVDESSKSEAESGECDNDCEVSSHVNGDDQQGEEQGLSV